MLLNTAYSNDIFYIVLAVFGGAFLAVFFIFIMVAVWLVKQAMKIYKEAAKRLDAIERRIDKDIKALTDGITKNTRSVRQLITKQGAVSSDMRAYIAEHDGVHKTLQKETEGNIKHLMNDINRTNREVRDLRDKMRSLDEEFVKHAHKQGDVSVKNVFPPHVVLITENKE